MIQRSSAACPWTVRRRDTSRFAALISSALITRVERKAAIDDEVEEAELVGGSGGRCRPVRGIFHSWRSFSSSSKGSVDAVGTWGSRSAEGGLTAIRPPVTRIRTILQSALRISRKTISRQRSFSE